MAYPDGLEGKYVRFRSPNANSLGTPGIVKDVTDGPVVSQTLTVFNTLDDANNLKSSNPPWTYNFLIYVPGIVTTTTLGTGVMTGPMSGCYLFKYTLQGARMAHVGTETSPQTPASQEAKTAWKALAARKDVSGITGASPLKAWQMMPPAGKRVERDHDVGPPVIYGYFTAGGAQTFALEFALISRRLKSAAGAGGGKEVGRPALVTAAPIIKVMRVVRMGMAPWIVLSQQPTFR
jgi:hypothetical protein